MTEIVLTSSVLILVITAVRYFLRGRFPLRLQYGMWALVALRLLVPVTFTASAFSVLNAVPAAGGMDALYISPEREILTWADGSQEPIRQYDYRPVQFGPASDDNTLTYVDGYDVAHEVEYERRIDLTAALRPVWYVGMAAMGVWFLGVNLNLRRKLRAGARRVEVSDCPVPVFAVEGIPSPCLFGLFRPAVYVTPACLEDEDWLRHVLEHELTHRRHGDQFWSLVRCVCLTVYWFHPLVWLAAVLSRRDCELACDEGALSRLGEEERTAYGRTLIGLMAVSNNPGRLLQTATTMVDGKRGLKERLTLIAKKPVILAAATVAVVLVVTTAVACTFTGAEAPEASWPNAVYATVEEALADMPAELGPSEGRPLSGIAVYTPKERSEEMEGLIGVTLEENEIFRGYWTAHLYLSSNLEDPLGWMASVYRLDQAGYDALTRSFGLNGGRKWNSCWECFAGDGEGYYFIYAPITAPELEGARLQEKLLAWIKQAVLSVQGVAPVDAARFNCADFTDSMPPFEPDWLDLDAFNAVKLSDDPRINALPVTVVGGFRGSDGLLHLQCRRGSGGIGGLVTLRPDGDGYALESIQWPTYKPSDIARPIPPGAVTIFTGTAKEAFQRLLNSDTSFLAEGANGDAWRSWLNSNPDPAPLLDCLLLDVDADGDLELLIQYPDSPATLNGVFDFRNGMIYCWRFDIMDGSKFQYALTDGTMVYEYHFGDMVSHWIFRYTPEGEREDVGSLACLPAGYGGSSEPASYQVDGQPVTKDEYERQVKALIEDRRLTASDWTAAGEEDRT